MLPAHTCVNATRMRQPRQPRQPARTAGASVGLSEARSLAAPAQTAARVRRGALPPARCSRFSPETCAPGGLARALARPQAPSEEAGAAGAEDAPAAAAPSRRGAASEPKVGALTTRVVRCQARTRQPALARWPERGSRQPPRLVRPVRRPHRAAPPARVCVRALRGLPLGPASHLASEPYARPNPPAQVPGCTRLVEGARNSNCVRRAPPFSRLDQSQLRTGAGPTGAAARLGPRSHAGTAYARRTCACSLCLAYPPLAAPWRDFARCDARAHASLRGAAARAAGC